MTYLSWLIGRTGGTQPLQRHTVGNALVLHLENKISPEAQSVALAAPPDPENDIVVLDVAGESDAGVWEAAAAALPWRRRGIRLMVCGMAADNAELVGQWLAQRLRRTVIAPRGRVIRASGGTLFVHSDPGSGWVRHQRGKEPVWEAKRFPRPQWDAAVVDHRTTSATAVIEPLPGGAWLHDERGGERVRENWKRLVTRLPCRPDRMAVVLGCPGTPALALDEIARFWRGLSEEHRESVRFVQYGPVERLTGGEPCGQFLADLLDQPVTCYAGLPVETGDDETMLTVDEDGALGWPMFATELRFHPRGETGDPAVAPKILQYRVPPELTEEVAPLTYWYATDAVVEVIPAGLWVRTDEEPGNADAVRRHPLRAGVHSLVFDDTAADRSARMKSLADDLGARLEPPVRAVTRLVPMSAVLGGAGRRAALGAPADAADEGMTVTASLGGFREQTAVEIARLQDAEPETSGPDAAATAGTAATEAATAAAIWSVTTELPVLSARSAPPTPPTREAVEPVPATEVPDNSDVRELTPAGESGTSRAR